MACQPPIISSRKRKSTELDTQKKPKHNDERIPIRLLRGNELIWTTIGKYLTFGETFNMCTVDKTFSNDLPDNEMCTSDEEGGTQNWDKCLGGAMFKEKVKDFQNDLKKREPALYTAMTELTKTFKDDDLILAGELQNIDTLSVCLTKRTNVLQDLQYVKSS